MTNPDVHGGAGEQAAEPLPDFTFAEPNAIDRLRVYHRDWINSARELELGRLPDDADEAAKEEARQRADERVADMVDGEYNDHFERGAERMRTDLHDRVAAILPKYAYRQMSDEEWNDGLEDADGNRQPSGRKRLQDEIDAIKLELLLGNDDPDDPDDPEDDPDDDPNTPPNKVEVLRLKGDLDRAREKLAQLSIKRRQLIRKGGKKAERLQEQYDEAKRVYDAANMAHSIARSRRYRAGIGDDDSQYTPPDETTFQAAVIGNILTEHQNFSKAEYAALSKDDSRRARFARFIVRHRLFLPANFAGGVAIGFGARWLSRGLLMGAAGIAAPAALAAGAAVKTTKAVYEANIGNRVYTERHFENFYKKDRDELQAQLADVQDEHASITGGTVEEQDALLIRNSHDEMQGVIDRRVETSRKKNRNRVVTAAVVGAAGGVAGELLEAGAEHLHLIGGLGAHGPHNAGSGGHGGNGGTGHGGNGGSGHNGNGHNGNGGNGHKPGASNPNGHKPDYEDGFNTNVQIGNGEGYEQALADLAHQKGIHMSEAQNWALYQHLNGIYHGNFLTNDPSYHMDNPGEWGISRPGAAHWNPAVVNEMNNWLHEHGITTQAAKVAKKAGKAAAGRVTRGALATAA